MKGGQSNIACSAGIVLQKVTDIYLVDVQNSFYLGAMMLDGYWEGMG